MYYPCLFSDKIDKAQIRGHRGVRGERRREAFDCARSAERDRLALAVLSNCASRGPNERGVHQGVALSPLVQVLCQPVCQLSVVQALPLHQRVLETHSLGPDRRRRRGRR